MNFFSMNNPEKSRRVISMQERKEEHLNEILERLEELSEEIIDLRDRIESLEERVERLEKALSK